MMNVLHVFTIPWKQRPTFSPIICASQDALPFVILMILFLMITHRLLRESTAPCYPERAARTFSDDVPARAVEIKSVRGFDITAWVATWERWGTPENPRADGEEAFAYWGPWLTLGIQILIACPSLTQVAGSVYLGTQWCSSIITLCGVFLLGGLEFARLAGTLLHARQYVPNVACVIFSCMGVFCVVCFEFMVIFVTRSPQQEAAALCVTFLTFSIFPVLYVIFSCAQDYMINIQGALTGGGPEKITLNRTAMLREEYHERLRLRWYAILLNIAIQVAYNIIGANMLEGDQQLSPLKISLVILIVDIAIAINMMGTEVGPSTTP